MGRLTVRRRIVRLDGARARHRPDTLAVEEPLEIRLSATPLSVTMRTPGHDFDLVAGLLYAEGVIVDAADIATMRHCADSGPRSGGSSESEERNVVDVDLAEHVRPPDDSVRRAFYTTSACGVCGKTSVDAIRTRVRHDVASDPMRVPPTVLAELPTRLRAAQRVFDRTGGLHAAGLFDADGTLRTLREDVGRHNAVDKVIGWALRAGLLPLSGHILLVSGRASFELVQKALLAGVPALAAVSAPSSLAAELAAESGMTLVGFLRGATMNIYAGAHRVSDQG